MPSRFPTVLMPKLLGLNLRDDKMRLNPGECETATNVICNPDGSAERITGYTEKLASSLGTSYCGSLAEFEKWDGTIETYFEYNGTLYQLDTATWTYRQVLSGLLAGARIGYAFYNNYIFFGNGYDVNKKIVPEFIHYTDRAAITTAVATTTASAITLAEAIRTDYNAHRVSTTYHNAADATNTVAAATATDLATCITLANELKVDINAHRSQSGVHPATDAYHEIEAADATSGPNLNTLVNDLRLGYNQHIGAGKALNWCIAGPSTAPTVGVTSSSGLDIGVYNWVYTHYNKVDGTESAPSPLGTATTIAGQQRALLSVMDNSTDPQVTHKRIYRTVVDGAIYYRVDEITNIKTTYTDSTTDANLGTILETADYVVVPPTNNFIVFKDRIYLAGDPDNPYRLYFTEATWPERYNSAYNYLDHDISITGLAQIESGLFVFEKHKTWLRSGTSPFNMSLMQISEKEGCTNPNAITYIDKYPIWLSSYGIRGWNGSSFERMSDLIDKQMLTKNLDSACLVYDGLNDLVYVIVANS
jgi:hypothetical protein